MFGYVRPVLSKLTQEDRERYQAAYCGLCHAMAKRYGFWARFTLNYDFTFLAMILALPGEQSKVCAKRCLVHPFRQRDCAFFIGLEAAADESLILTWHKLRDDMIDKGFWEGLPARLSTAVLGRAYRKAAALRPDFDKKVSNCLEELHRLEQEKSASMDRAADTFARILGAAAPETGAVERERVLGQLLYHVGRWIYLADAWDDLADDRAQGNYNPLDVRFQGRPEEHVEELRTTMIHSIKLAISAYQLEQFGDWDGIIKNILYLGLPTVQEAVLAGKWREIQRSREKLNEGSLSGLRIRPQRQRR